MAHASVFGASTRAHSHSHDGPHLCVLAAFGTLAAALGLAFGFFLAAALLVLAFGFTLAAALGLAVGFFFGMAFGFGLDFVFGSMCIGSSTSIKLEEGGVQRHFSSTVAPSQFKPMRVPLHPSVSFVFVYHVFNSMDDFSNVCSRAASALAGVPPPPFGMTVARAVGCVGPGLSGVAVGLRQNRYGWFLTPRRSFKASAFTWMLR